MSLVVVALGLVPIVGFMLLPTCPGILWTFTESWVSYGGALLSDARYARGQPRSVCVAVMGVGSQQNTSVQFTSLIGEHPLRGGT